MRLTSATTRTISLAVSSLLAFSLTCLGEDKQKEAEAIQRSLASFDTRGGRINIIEGDVRVRGAQANGRRFATHNELNDGDVIITFARSRAEIVLRPAYFLRLDENTTCTISDMKEDDQKISIRRGAALVEILQNSAGSFGVDAYDLLTVCTPHGECCISGNGVFLIEVEGSQSILSAVKGEAIAANQRVRQGKQAILKDGGSIAVEAVTNARHPEFQQWSANRAALLSNTNKGLTTEEWYKVRQRGNSFSISEPSDPAEDVFTTSAANGRVTFAEDGVEHQADGKPWAPLSKQSNLKDGDRIRSQPGSRAQIALCPGVLLSLSGQSELSYSEDTATGIRMSLVRGSAIIAAVTPDSLRDLPLVISSSNAQFPIRQAGNYRVNVGQDSTEMLVRRGRILIGTQEAKSGYRVKVSKETHSIEPLDQSTQDTFDVWSARRERGEAVSSQMMWRETRQSRLHRTSRIGVWYFCRSAGFFTFVPGMWDFKSPYGGSYPVKMRFGKPLGPRPLSGAFNDPRLPRW